ncbi:MAG: hypothetical protein GY754_17725 [bacterium]|nr:hypothetical protein [bacterium]
MRETLLVQKHETIHSLAEEIAIMLISGEQDVEIIDQLVHEDVPKKKAREFVMEIKNGVHVH